MVHWCLLLLALAAGQQADFFLISDIHLDLAYDQGYESSGLCHSVGVVGKNRTITPAPDLRPLGRFGCDSPLPLLSSALSQMQALNPSPDFILVTGDLIGHSTYYLLQPNGVYNTTYTAALLLSTFQQVTAQFRSFFPSTQVLFALGNNDGYGDYQLPTTDSALGLNALLYDLWQPLNSGLPEDFIDSGFYACNITATGQRLLVLSTNYFSVSVNGVNSAAMDQLKWLRSELISALNNHQRVVISMHIPPGAGMYNANSYDWHESFISLFEKLMNVYGHIVDFVFAAHQHQSGFQLIGESGLAVVIHPAISPIFSNNPGFRHYQLSAKGQDYTDYFLDLFAESPTWATEVVFSVFSGLQTFDYPSLYHQLLGSESQLFEYLVVSHGLSRDLGVYINDAYIWKQALGLLDESFMRRVALCSYRYFSNTLFDLCKMGLLPVF